MMWRHGPWDPWVWMAMTVCMLVLVAAVAAGIVFLARGMDRGSREPSAQDILDRKLAEGEIDDVEYHMRTSALATRVDQTSRDRRRPSRVKWPGS
jgi:uncharacterized membrane protein